MAGSPSHPAADWLEALETMVLPASAPPSAPVSERGKTCFAWHLSRSSQGLQVDVFACRPAVRGWRKDERIPPKDLPEPGSPQWELLGPGEQRALQALNRWRRRSGGIPFDLLSALEGHERLSWAEAPGQDGHPVRLVREVAALEVQASEDGWRVRLWPRAGSGAPRLHCEGDRLLFTGFTPLHLALDNLLGEERQVRKEDGARLTRVLGRLWPHLPILSDLLPDPAPPPAPPERALRLWTHLQGERLRVSLWVQPAPGLRALAPGAGPRLAIAGQPRRLWTRDLDLEKHRFRQILDRLEPIARKNPKTGEWHLDGRERGWAFLASLRPLGGRVRLEGLPGFQAALPQAVQPGDWEAETGASGDLRASLGGCPLQELLPALQSVGRFLPLPDGRVLDLENELGRGLRWMAAWCRSENGVLKAPAPGLAFMALPARPALWDQAPPEMPETFLGTLREYQRAGFSWMAARLQAGLGACLADDMGLGKTVQTAAILALRSAQGPALVVAPSSVRLIWSAELARFVPSLRVRDLGDGMPDDPGAGDVILASYGLLTSRSQELQGVEWATVVLDEAHAIKNADTLRAQISRQLRSRARLALTGTPVENHPEELASLLSWLLPEAEEQLRSAGLEQLRAMAAPFLLRRRKSEVLKELPPKTERTVRVVLDPGEREFHRSLRERLAAQARGASAIHLLAALMTLRRACAHPRLVDPAYPGSAAKLDLLMDHLCLLQEEGQQSLVFSQFTDLLDLLEPRLKEAGIPFCRLDGTLSLAARKKAVTAFQSGEARVFLLSLKAGGTGLNLTAADHVFHLDPWWNPAVEDQATDRAHRLGRTRPVAVHRLVAEGTVEERVLDLHQQKREMIERLLEGTDEPANLDRAWLEGLLG